MASFHHSKFQYILMLAFILSIRRKKFLADMQANEQRYFLYTSYIIMNMFLPYSTTFFNCLSTSTKKFVSSSNYWIFCVIVIRSIMLQLSAFLSGHHYVLPFSICNCQYTPVNYYQSPVKWPLSINQPQPVPRGWTFFALISFPRLST